MGFGTGGFTNFCRVGLLKLAAVRDDELNG
jgi:hypothetical protein